MVEYFCPGLPVSGKAGMGWQVRKKSKAALSGNLYYPEQRKASLLATCRIDKGYF